jgi:putative redox protein
MDSSWKEIVAEWKGGTTFIGTNLAQGAVQMGSLNDVPGISPMELMLVSLAGCTGMDVVSILQKKRQPVQRFEVRVKGKRADDHPRVYTEIEIIYMIWGDGLDPNAVEQAIHLSEEKYCSVSAMIKNTAKINWKYVISPNEALKTSDM